MVLCSNVSCLQCFLHQQLTPLSWPVSRFTLANIARNCADSRIPTPLQDTKRSPRSSQGSTPETFLVSCGTRITSDILVYPGIFPASLLDSLESHDWQPNGHWLATGRNWVNTARMNKKLHQSYATIHLTWPSAARV